MGLELARLNVLIGADLSELEAKLKGASGTLQSAGARMQAIGGKIKDQFSGMTDSTLTWSGALKVLGGATALGYAAKKVFDLGANVEETASKFNTVFGPSVQGAQSFLDRFANTAGLTNVQGQDLLATTGAIAQGMGFTQKASADFSQQVVSLAGDLTSFNNIPIEETSRAIQSALTGERESLKTLGIVILETDVQQRALQNTGKATAASLTQQEKATATLQLITERAGVAVGDLARTMDSPANRARALTAKLLTLRDSMAHALLPAMGVVLEEVGNSVGGFDQFGRTLEENSGVIAAWAKFTVAAVKTVALALAAPIRIAFNLGQVIGRVLVAAVQAMRGNFSGARETLGAMVGDFGDMGDSVAKVIAGFDDMRIASGLAWDSMRAGKVAVSDVSAKVAALDTALANTGGGGGGGGGGGDPFSRLTEWTKEFAPGLATMTAGLADTAAAMTDLSSTATETGPEMSKWFGSVEDMSGRLSGAIVDFASGSKDAIKQFVTSAIADLARLAVKMAAMRILGAILAPITGGASLGIAAGLSGFAASGANVRAGESWVVGENGPEIFQPGMSGQVRPIESGGGVNSGEIAAALRSRPRPMTPREAAQDEWWVSFFSEVYQIAGSRGLRLGGA